MDRKTISVSTINEEVCDRLNRRFHERFYACAGSPHLLELIPNIWDRVESSMAVYASTVDDFTEAHRQHLRMLELIESRDLPGLLDETAWHLEHTSRTVAEALAEALGAELSAPVVPGDAATSGAPDESGSPARHHHHPPTRASRRPGRFRLRGAPAPTEREET